MKQFAKTPEGETWWFADFKGIFQRMIPANSRSEALTKCRKIYGYPSRLKRVLVVKNK